MSILIEINKINCLGMQINKTRLLFFVFKAFLIIAFLIIFAENINAQPFDPPEGGDPVGGTNGAPIDGGLLWLIIGGVGYAAYKFKEKNKNKH